jgi:hypothetical protein
MDLACLDGVGPIVHHHIVVVADVCQAATHKQISSFFATNMVFHSQAFKLLQQTWSYTVKLSSFCTKHGHMVLHSQTFKLLQKTWFYTVKLSNFCNKHGLTQSSFQAFATNMILHSQAFKLFATNMVLLLLSQDFKLLQQTWSCTVKLSSFCNKHGLAHSSCQAFATMMVLHT